MIESGKKQDIECIELFYRDLLSSSGNEERRSRSKRKETWPDFISKLFIDLLLTALFSLIWHSFTKNTWKRTNFASKLESLMMPGTSEMHFTSSVSCRKYKKSVRYLLKSSQVETVLNLSQERVTLLGHMVSIEAVGRTTERAKLLSANVGIFFFDQHNTSGLIRPICPSSTR